MILSSEKPALSAQDYETRKREFETLTMGYLDALYRQAYGFTYNAARAEDLVQDTYLKAFGAFDSFERGTKIKAWLFRILRNTFISDYRKKKREPEVPYADDYFSFYDAVAKDVQACGEKVQDADSLDPFKLEQVLGDEVTKALEQLSTEFREVIYLCDVQELSYQEMASIIDVPVGTVRSRLARARAMLQKFLFDYAKNKGLWRRPSVMSKAKEKLRELFSGVRGQKGFWRTLFL